MEFSLADHLDAASRSLSTVTRDGRELRQLRATRTFDATPDEVWDALVSPERIPRWLAPVSGDLVLGGRFQVEGNAGGEILTCRPPERLSVTWEYAGDTSWVDVSLRPDGEGTELRLDHSVNVNDHYRRFGPGATGIGWELMLMGLAEHLAAPDAPRPEGDDLPDLRDYMASSGTAWAGARIAAGDAPDEARAAAERCLAAYLGEG